MINDALRTILPIAGWPEERTRAIDITGGTDPILPTPFRISETSAAALAAVGLAVSDLWALRSGRRQGIAIDARQATASLRGGSYLRMDGTAVPSGHNTIMGMYPTKQGRWSYIHSNFPNHRSAALKVLGVQEDREAVRKAVAQWDTQELEEALIAANGAGGMVRISLAQVGRWLVERGHVPGAGLRNVTKEFTPEELERWSMTSNTPLGRLQHLGPVVQLSETPPRWARPTVPLGYNETVWPAPSPTERG